MKIVLKVVMYKIDRRGEGEGEGVGGGSKSLKDGPHIVYIKYFIKTPVRLIRRGGVSQNPPTSDFRNSSYL